MPDAIAIHRSVDNITSMFACCVFMFGVMVFRLSTSNILSWAWKSSDAETPKDRLIVSVKMIALMMAAPVIFFLVAIFGEIPTLWHAYPVWCGYTAALSVALAALIASLFYLDQEDIEEYTIEFSKRAAVDATGQKRDAEKKIVGVGFGLWILGMAISFAWLLYLSGMSLSDVFETFK